ncbi:MAG TPA: copper resistance protein CopC [Mycobacteriales bacterium]|nr:copper resistance protein CopC [Mycobacteriales bacterium]
MRRPLTRLAVVMPIAFAFAFALAAPASAHAVVERSTPAAGTVLRTSPPALSLVFDETVLAANDALHLYDDRLTAVRLGATSHPQGRGSVITAPVRTALGPGTYTVTWRVTSADTHVVSGSFTFSVGHPTEVSGVPPGNGVDPATSHLAAVARGLGYAGLVGGPGALVVMAWLWPAGLSRRRMRVLVIGGGALLVVATVAGVVAQGAAAAGVPVEHAVSWSALRLGMAGRFGRAAGARIVLLVAIAWTAAVSGRRGQVSASQTSAVAAVLATTWPYAGHSGTGDLVALAFVADWVHVAAMATWLGGLMVALSGLLGRTGERDPAEAAHVMDQFSEWALAAVSLLVATGLFAAWRNVRAFGALTATHYGRLLLWKSGVVVVVLVAAYLSRRFAANGAGRAESSLQLLRRTVVAEAVGAVVILGITAFLTGTAQASQTYAPALTRSAVDGGITATVHVDRTGVGATQVVVTMTRGGRAQPIEHIDGSLTELDPPVGPLPVTFRPSGMGREVATVTFPDPGEWALSLDVQTSSVNEVALSTAIRIRE